MSVVELAKASGLTVRQLEVASMIVGGMSTVATAAALKVTQPSVSVTYARARRRCPDLPQLRRGGRFAATPFSQLVRNSGPDSEGLDPDAI